MNTTLRLAATLCILLISCNVLVNSSSSGLESSIYCQSKSCLELQQFTNNVLANVNQSADPCVDLHGSVCGGWQKVVSKPKHLARYGTLSSIQQKHKTAFFALLKAQGNTNNTSNSAISQLRKFYQQCSASAFPHPFQDSFIQDRVKLYKSWKFNTPANLHRALNENLRTGGSFLLGATIDSDPRNSSLMAVWVMQGGLSLRSTKNYQIKSSREALMVFLGQIIRDFEIADITPQQIIQFEQQLVKISASPTEMRNPHLAQRYNKKSILFPPEWTRKQMVTRAVIADNAQYFEKLEELILATPPNILKGYFISSQLQALLAYTDYAPIHQLKYRTLHVRRPKREQHCIDTISRLAPHLAAHAQLTALREQGNLLDALRKDVQGLVITLRDFYLELLEKNSWLSSTMRKRTIEKMSKLSMLLISELWLLDARKIAKYHSKFTTKHTWIETTTWLRTQSILKLWEKLKYPNKRLTQTSPMVANAFYSQPNNRIVIPYGILHPPVYHIDYPLPLKLAGLGMIIAHELTHSLDSRGREYDWRGNLHDWWEEDDAAEFHERASCFSRQYSNYTIQGIPLNGILTNAENIADNVALRIVTEIAGRVNFCPTINLTRADGTTLTSRQAFFTHYAMIWCSHFDANAERSSLHTAVHAPARWRINGCLENRPQFSSAFNCSTGNKTNMCRLW